MWLQTTRNYIYSYVHWLILPLFFTTSKKGWPVQYPAVYDMQFSSLNLQFKCGVGEANVEIELKLRSVMAALITCLLSPHRHQFIVCTLTSSGWCTHLYRDADKEKLTQRCSSLNTDEASCKRWAANYKCEWIKFQNSSLKMILESFTVATWPDRRKSERERGMMKKWNWIGQVEWKWMWELGWQKLCVVIN